MSTELAEKRDPPATCESTEESLEAKFTVRQYGVWRIFMRRTESSHKAAGEVWTSAVIGLRLVRRFTRDVWHVSPTLCFSVGLAQISDGLRTSLLLYASNRLLTAVSISGSLTIFVFDKISRSSSPWPKGKPTYP